MLEGFSLGSYLLLVDYTGRLFRDGKAAISAELSPAAVGGCRRDGQIFLTGLGSARRPGKKKIRERGAFRRPMAH
jgi:hypothetical protein